MVVAAESPRARATGGSMPRPQTSLWFRTISRAISAVAVFAPFLCLASAHANLKSPQTPAANLATATQQDASPAVDPSTATKKSKKVWTNEDVAAMGRPVSVVGDGREAKNKSAVQKPADPQYIAGVRKQLEKFQGQLADADKEFATLKNFNDGE